ncbi:hypothetical protein [Flavobacterium aurantiibacter]|uniref:Uncharacterized protein n=1 Tax=Flavobacterium aurantiibacter TaxID=2023067 RepID=A0A255ZAP6_9FLAO|nr:hypothetical protein [Flavobacterium aurantiibacter]OYQ38491.1 hypothetical protein CHX27_15150 [Flavobacterium aurantiibacter]
MKKFLFIALFATGFANATGNLPMEEIKNSGELPSPKDYACCTKSATATLSDGKGNETSVTRVEEACVNNGRSVDETMPIACEEAQKAADKKAVSALLERV